MKTVWGNLCLYRCMPQKRIQVPHYYKSNYPQSRRCGSTPGPNELKWKVLDWLNLTMSASVKNAPVSQGLSSTWAPLGSAQGAVMGMNGCLDSSCARWFANTWLSTARASTSCCSWALLASMDWRVFWYSQAWRSTISRISPRNSTSCLFIIPKVWARVSDRIAARPAWSMWLPSVWLDSWQTALARGKQPSSLKTSFCFPFHKLLAPVVFHEEE